MSNAVRSATGKIVNMERLVLANEEVAAVGNHRVNARGDELGPNGTVIRSRTQVMKEFYDPNGAQHAAAASFDGAIIAERERARKQRTAGAKE